MQGLTAMFEQVKMNNKIKPKLEKLNPRYGAPRGKLYIYNDAELTLRQHCDNEEVDAQRVRGYLKRGLDICESIRIVKKRR